MISKITLKKVASYGNNPVTLETDKKFNFIYGLNGSGKTTLSNFLGNKDDLIYKDCSIEGINDEKILVYNQNFIEKNFYESSIQKGIFSLSSENKEAKENIDKATDEIKKIDLQIKDEGFKKGLFYDLEKENKKLGLLNTEYKNKIWEIKTKYSGGDRVLEFCLEGKRGSSETLFNHVLSTVKPLEDFTVNIDNLKKEAELTQGDDAKIYDENEIKEINFDFFGIEINSIFSEVIIGNDNLQVSDLIKTLNNSDWVSKGLDFTQEPKEKNSICPFCQSETISTHIYEEIKNYFDETYNNKIKELKRLDSEYFNAYQNIKNQETELLENVFIDNKKIEFKLLYQNLISKLSSNWFKINDKVKNPSKIIVLESTILEKKALNDFLKDIIDEIKLHNLKIKNKSKTKKEIINNFWKVMRITYDKDIELYKTKKENLEKSIEKIDKEIKNLEEQKLIQKEIIKTSQKESINIDEAINNINIELNSLGTEGFNIEKIDETSYGIKREKTIDCEFKTLSEGEKTIISFLYFIELCKGKSDENEVLKEKIIVIDDPISSLSHIYIFNISQIIKRTFFNSKFKQIFLLTHSLYFFHELMKILPKEKSNQKFDGKLFRIRKNKNSFIDEMGQSEVQNDYQSYWKVLKDHNDGKSSDALLANSMRNILEYFFGFIDNDKYKEAITKIDKVKYNYFLRYIDRESHYDNINITDLKEIDSSIFKEAFKEIFYKSGYMEHYNKMVGT